MTIEEYEKLIPAMKEAQAQGAWRYDQYNNCVQMDEEGYLAWFGYHCDGVKNVEVSSGPHAEVYTMRNGVMYFIWMTDKEAAEFVRECESRKEETPVQPSIIEPVKRYVAAMDNAKEELDELIEELSGQ